MSYILERIVLVVFVCSVTIACVKEENLSESSFEDVSVNYNTIELELMNIVNNYRIEMGLTKLNSLGLITKEAETHSDYMVEKDLISHDNFYIRRQNLLKNAGAQKVGENVAYGYTTANAVMNAWLASPVHKSIIEKESYTDFGVSAKMNDSGRYYFTQIFIER